MDASLLDSPALIDLILIFTAIEAGLLIVVYRLTGRGLPPGAVGRMLLPGIFLMLAVRAAMAGWAWPFVPLMLAAALVAHLVDLRGRWRKEASGGALP